MYALYPCVRLCAVVEALFFVGSLRLNEVEESCSIQNLVFFSAFFLFLAYARLRARTLSPSFFSVSLLSSLMLLQYVIVLIIIILKHIALGCTLKVQSASLSTVHFAPV